MKSMRRGLAGLGLGTAVWLSAPVARAEPAAALTLRVNVPGATLQLDGQPAAPASPGPRELAPGSHRLQIARSGFTRWEGQLTLAAGQQAQVDVELRPGRVPLICFVSMAAISAATLGAGGGVLGAAHLDSASPSTVRTAVGATLLGLGGVAAITTGVLGAFVRWRRASARIEITPAPGGAAVVAGGTLP